MTDTQPRFPPPLQNAAHNYDQALYLSLLFYEAQRSGPLPADKRIPWRGDSATQDQGQKGEDLTGGYSDGPSSQKVMLPAAWTTTVLAWGVLEFGDAYQAAGEYDNVLDALRWSYDYMVRAPRSIGLGVVVVVRSGAFRRLTNPSIT